MTAPASARFARLRVVAPAIAALALACGATADEAGDEPPGLDDAGAVLADGGSLGDATPAADGATVAAPPPYPIVFVHGMAGFDAIRPAGLTVKYWGTVVEDLGRRGEAAFDVELPPYDSSEARARALETQLTAILAKTGAAKVNLIAHSQGGLDARLLVSPAGLGWGDRVATLVTVATPHRGTKVADLVTGVGDVFPASVSDRVFDGLAKLLQVTVYDLKNDPHLRARIRELSTKYANETFNPKYTNDARVRYLSWGGRSNLRPGFRVCDGGAVANDPTKLDVLNPLFLGVAPVTEWGFPPAASDGLVTVASAKWGTFQGCVPADHLDQIGVQDVNGVDLTVFDYAKFYAGIVAELRAHGD